MYLVTCVKHGYFLHTNVDICGYIVVTIVERERINMLFYFSILFSKYCISNYEYVTILEMNLQ